MLYYRSFFPKSLAAAALLAAGSLSAVAQDAAPAEAAAAPASANASAETPADVRSYSLGVALADSVTSSYEGLNVDYKVLLEGFAAKIKGEKLAVTDATVQEQVQKVSAEAQQKMRAAEEEQMKEMEKQMATAGQANKEKGEKFLAENKKKEGVKTTASGLQYIVEREGTGATPKPSDTVTAHYKGTLLDGTVFDSSYDRGEPLTLPVGGVIRGWQEALQLMKVGSKFKIFIPSDLAYGPQGAGGDIGPNETLIFEMELISIGGK